TLDADLVRGEDRAARHPGDRARPRDPGHRAALLPRIGADADGRSGETVAVHVQRRSGLHHDADDRRAPAVEVRGQLADLPAMKRLPAARDGGGMGTGGDHERQNHEPHVDPPLRRCYDASSTAVKVNLRLARPIWRWRETEKDMVEDRRADRKGRTVRSISWILGHLPVMFS